jgi:hypothetical protein
METTTELPVITTEKAKGEISLQLTKLGFTIEGLSKRCADLSFSEDQESLNAIKEVLGQGKKVINAIADKHAIGKEPFLEGGRKWDAAKNELTKLVQDIVNPIQTRYNQIANELDRKDREKKAKEAREKEVRAAVEGAVIEYTKRIAAAETTEDLLKIESSISAQKAPQAKAKYGDLHDEAIALYNEKLLPILKDQKEKLAEKERLAAELKAAEQADDVTKIDEIKASQEVVQDHIRENAVKAQETGLQTNFTAPKITPHEVVQPQVKAKRTTIRFELVDAEAAIKRGRNLIEISLNTDRCKEAAATLKDSGAFKDKDEITVNGIRFFVDKTY